MAKWWRTGLQEMRLAAGIVLSQLGNQRSANPQRRGVGCEPGCSSTQNRKPVGSAFLRHVTDGEPVQGSAHRVMI